MAEAAERVLTVGTPLTQRGDTERLPVGTVIRARDGRVHEKRGLNRWVNRHTGRPRFNSYFQMDGRHHIESLPDSVQTQNSEGQDMTLVQTMDQFTALETGTTVTAAPDNNLWTKQEDGRWSGVGAMLDESYFRTDVEAGRVRIGVTPAVGQVWQDGNYYYLIVSEDSAQPGQWWTVLFYISQFHAVQSRRQIPGAIIDNPPWMNERMSALASQLVRLHTLTEERQRQLNSAVGERDRAIARLTQVQRQLHAFVASHSDTRNEVNAVLTGVELLAAPITVEVTVLAQITEVKSLGRGESLKPFVSLEPVAGSEISASNQALLAYRTEFQMPVTASEGTCACGRVSRASAIEFLRGKGVSLHAYETVSRRCPSENCENAE